MIDAVDRLGLWLLNLGVLTAAWLSLLMIAMIACRQPGRRRALARAGLLGALGLAPLSLLPIAGLGPLGSPRLLPGDLDPSAWRTNLPLDGLGRVLTLAYLAAVALGIAWLRVGSWAIRRVIQSSREPSTWAIGVYEILPFSGGAARRPSLRISGKLGRPALLGGLRPIIVIPEAWDDPGPGSADRLRLALLHELAHAEHRDPTFYRLSGLLRALWFLLPPAWWLRRQLLLDQELLADDQAARRLGSATAHYATSLVDLAAGALTPSAPPGATAGQRTFPTIEPHDSPLLLRVAMLLRCPFPIEPTAPRWWRFGTWSLAIALMVLASRFSIVEPGSEDGASRPEPSLSRASPFHLHEFDVGAGMGGRPLRLPAPLPEYFEISARLLADPAALPEIAIAGYRLGLAADHPAPAGSDPEGWYRLRLVVDDRGARLWIDDRPGIVTPDPAPSGSSLTIRPPGGHAMQLRDLVLLPIDPAGPPDATASRGPAGRDRPGAATL